MFGVLSERPINGRILDGHLTLHEVGEVVPAELSVGFDEAFLDIFGGTVFLDFLEQFDGFSPLFKSEVVPYSIVNRLWRYYLRVNFEFVYNSKIVTDGLSFC